MGYLANPKTTITGYIGLLTNGAAFLSSLGAICGGGAWCLKLAVVGAGIGTLANSLSAIMAKDGGH